MRRVAISALFLIITSCGGSQRLFLAEFQPVAASDCRLEVRSYPRELAIGSELLARYSLTNTSRHSVRGCVSILRRWTFQGSDGSVAVQRSGDHVVCEPEGQFLLNAGETFSWLDAVDVPAVGVGRVAVNVELELVVLDPAGVAPFELRGVVTSEFALDVTSDAPRL
jgi:hypothetical protein